MSTVPSIFNRVLGEHEEAQATEAFAARERADLVAASRAAFASAFREAAFDVVRPIFLQFVEDANARGFSARVEESIDDPVRPAIALFVNPRKGRPAERAASDDCSLELKALIETSEVEHVTHFDRRENDRGYRINPDGSKKGTYGVSSLGRDAIERQVEAFWALSLRSRKAE